jgi:hypothetical protein
MGRTRMDAATADASPQRQRRSLTARGKMTVVALIGLASRFLIILPLFVIAMVAGFAATVQNYRCAS